MPAHVSRSGPIEETCQPILPYIVRFHLNRTRGIVRHESSISPYTVSRTHLLVYVLRRTRSRKVLVLERSFLTCVSGIGVANAMGFCE